jgi:hypothetical protein
MVSSIAGGVIGLALAAVALRAGVSRLPQTLPRINEIGLTWRVMLFALGLSVLTGFLCGLAPTFAAIRTSVNKTLKEGGSSNKKRSNGSLVPSDGLVSTNGVVPGWPGSRPRLHALSGRLYLYFECVGSVAGFSALAAVRTSSFVNTAKGTAVIRGNEPGHAMSDQDTTAGPHRRRSGRFPVRRT